MPVLRNDLQNFGASSVPRRDPFNLETGNIRHFQELEPVFSRPKDRSGASRGPKNCHKLL